MGEAGDKIMRGLDEALQHSKAHREDLALLQSLKVMAEQALEKGFAGWSEIAKRARTRLEAAMNASDTLLGGLEIGDWVSHPSCHEPVNIVGFEISPDRAMAAVCGSGDGCRVVGAFWHLPIAELTRVDKPKVHHLQVGGDVTIHGPWAATADEFNNDQGMDERRPPDRVVSAPLSAILPDPDAPLDGC